MCDTRGRVGAKAIAHYSTQLPPLSSDYASLYTFTSVELSEPI